MPTNLGPNAPGNFFDEKWQRDLSDKSAKSKPIRQGVLGRMRLPVTEDNKYDQARSGQAYPYFMPWLSGDGGTLVHDVKCSCFNMSFLCGVWAQGEPPRGIHPLFPRSLNCNMIALSNGARATS